MPNDHEIRCFEPETTKQNHHFWTVFWYGFCFRRAESGCGIAHRSTWDKIAVSAEGV